MATLEQRRVDLRRLPPDVVRPATARPIVELLLERQHQTQEQIERAQHSDGPALGIEHDQPMDVHVAHLPGSPRDL